MLFAAKHRSAERERRQLDKQPLSTGAGGVKRSEFFFFLYPCCRRARADGSHYSRPGGWPRMDFYRCLFVCFLLTLLQRSRIPSSPEGEVFILSPAFSLFEWVLNSLNADHYRPRSQCPSILRTCFVYVRMRACFMRMRACFQYARVINDLLRRHGCCRCAHHARSDRMNVAAFLLLFRMDLLLALTGIFRALSNATRLLTELYSYFYAEISFQKWL